MWQLCGNTLCCFIAKELKNVGVRTISHILGIIVKMILGKTQASTDSCCGRLLKRYAAIRQRTCLLFSYKYDCIAFFYKIEFYKRVSLCVVVNTNIHCAIKTFRRIRLCFQRNREVIL